MNLEAQTKEVELKPNLLHVVDARKPRLLVRWWRVAGRIRLLLASPVASFRWARAGRKAAERRMYMQATSRKRPDCETGDLKTPGFKMPRFRKPCFKEPGYETQGGGTSGSETLGCETKDICIPGF